MSGHELNNFTSRVAQTEHRRHHHLVSKHSAKSDDFAEIGHVCSARHGNLIQKGINRFLCSWSPYNLRIGMLCK
ncbi:hypothetical protein C1H46_012268 [Malus baccata]|uniref:Uncharacterized protein n=1 Tax=Malus baccata TaxID=106549 RepID=A0A540MUV2_MALBA|nr:hypothetical protein C1H46_012268 [Malus baccata]